MNLNLRYILSAFLIICHIYSLFASSPEEDHKEAEKFLKAGIKHLRSDQYKEAISNCRLALTIWNKLPQENKSKIIYSNACLANAYWNDCKAELADECIRICEEELERTEDLFNPGLADAYLLMAEFYLYAEYSFGLSDKYLYRATRILRKDYSNDDFLNAIFCFLKGYSDYLKHDYENALQYMNRSVQLSRNNPLLLRYEYLNYRYISFTYYSFENDPQKTLAFCNDILSKSMLPLQSEAILNYIAGLAYIQLEDKKQAERSFNKAVRLAITQNTNVNNSTLSKSYIQLSDLYRHNKVKQLEFLFKGLERAQQISSWDKDVINMLSNVALFYYESADYKKALFYLQKAIIAGSHSFSDTSYIKNPSPGDIRRYHAMVQILSLKARALVRVTDNELSYLKSAFECIELAAELSQQWVTEIDEEASGLFMAERRKSIYNNAVIYASFLYQQTGERIYAEKALNYSEKSKMQVLLITTAKFELLEKACIPDSLVRQSDNLGKAIIELENRIALARKEGNLNEVQSLNTKLTGLYDERDSLNYSLREQYPEFKNARYDLQIPDIDEIQSTLSSDQAILEYQLTNRQIITFVITSKDFYLIKQQIDTETRNHINKLRDKISINPVLDKSDSSFAEFTTSSHYLYKLLIGPVYDKIKGKRLVIIPHNELTLIPFEVLISDIRRKPANYRTLPYLVKEFPVIYAYSVSFLLNRGPGNKYGKGTAVFVPDYGKEYYELKGAKEEARLLKKMSGGRLYSGPDACESRFKEEASQYRVLHIASHTQIDENKPDLSGFVMNAPDNTFEDGMLYAYELKQLRLNAQLVVLSGCNTGFGQLRLSEGLVSLARSFYYSGVRTVAFTLWQIADKAEAQIIREFYRELNEDRPLDIAATKAKIRFLENADPVKSHPYFWAGFIVSGKTESIQLKKYSGVTAVATILVIGAIVGLVIAIKKFRKN